jgi:hypothetical protein
MASDKRRHKDAKIAREKQNLQSGGPKKKDGDRRWRGGLTADQGLKDKMAQILPEQFLNRSSRTD